MIKRAYIKIYLFLLNMIKEKSALQSDCKVQRIREEKYVSFNRIIQSTIDSTLYIHISSERQGIGQGLPHAEFCMINRLKLIQCEIYLKLHQLNCNREILNCGRGIEPNTGLNPFSKVVLHFFVSIKLFFYTLFFFCLI